jgi:hypothetical protein
MKEWRGRMKEWRGRMKEWRGRMKERGISGVFSGVCPVEVANILIKSERTESCLINSLSSVDGNLAAPQRHNQTRVRVCVCVCVLLPIP